MNRFFVVVAVGIAFGAQPVEVRADWTVAEFLDVCAPGSLQPCASVMVKTQWDANAGQNGETLVEIWVRNEQGSSLYDNTGGSFITQIGLTAPHIGTVRNFGVTTSGDVGRQGNPNNRWSVDNGALGGQVAFGATAASNLRGGIRGCGDPADHAGQYFTTCGGDGYVVFSFTAEGQVTTPQVALQFEAVADPNDPGASASMVCRTADGCVSVTPEPSTWILLATGMVGIFGMSWVRRRREDADAA